ncbi:hypothetical protein PQX77_009567 [Marasmius sp. AFHP31]|nr:hypothetical protein PQX77_009567 [Marasmius sp. AFHP31]
MPSFFPNNVAPLPQFSSLLVKGPYHPSAPIHLALSTLDKSVEGTALFLSTSSIHLNLALRQYNDDWLTTQSGHGNLTAVSSRVQIFYPPTPAHLVFLLSTFHVVESSANDSDIASSKSVLASCPSLIVLHELSSYFLRDVETNPTSHKWTISSYLNLVTHTASLISFLTRSITTNTALVLFDSRIDELRLPVVANPSNDKDRIFGLMPQPPKPEEVVALVQKYFQYTATFTEGFSSSDCLMI